MATCKEQHCGLPALAAIPEEERLPVAAAPELACPEPRAATPELEPVPLDDEQAARTTKIGKVARYMGPSAGERS